MPTVLLRSEESAGVVSMIELSSDAGFAGPPLHHHDFDEAFYVLDGELTFQLGDEVSRAPRARSCSRRATAPTRSRT